MPQTRPGVLATFVIPAPTRHPGGWRDVLGFLTALRDPRWEAVVVHAGEPAGAEHDDARVRHVYVDAKATLGQAMSAGWQDSRGQYVAFLSPASQIMPAMTRLLDEAAVGTADVIYGDERIAGDDFAKPDFSAERLRCQSYLGDATLYRRSTIEALAPTLAELPGAEPYDLALRATRSPAVVTHVGAVVSSRGQGSAATEWGVAVDRQLAAIESALAAHLDETGGGRVVACRAHGTHDTRRTVHGEPLVSIVIPTRGDSAKVRGAQRCLVVEAVRSIVERSTYRHIEFVVVIDDGSPADVAEQLRELAGDSLKLVPWSEPFNFSRKMNLGVLEASGDFMLLLNDDTEVISPGWIEALLGLAQRPEVGIAGAMLYFEDDTIQHAGHAYSRLDVTHVGMFSERGAAGPWEAFALEREVAGVTAACAMVRKDRFIEVGGFSPLLPGNFNDVDLCMKLASRGYRAMWTPHAELYHFESKTRDPRVSKYEVRTAWRRWEHLFWDSPWWPHDPHEKYTLTSTQRLH